MGRLSAKKLGLIILIISALFTPKIIEAIDSWNEVDINSDGTVDAQDVVEALGYLGCPEFGDCPDQQSPTPTSVPKDWSSCEECSFGTQLVLEASASFIQDVDPFQQGYVFTGSPFNAIDINPDPDVQFGFADLDGWQRGFIEGVMSRLQNKPAAAIQAGLEDHYEYLAYAPESLHSAGTEALWPDVNVPIVKGWAEDAGKKLLYAPSRQDYDQHISEVRPDVNIEHLIADVAQYVDIWGIQLGFLQGDVDEGDMPEEEFMIFLTNWVNRIKVGKPEEGHPGNPNTKIVVQLGIAKYDKATETCLPADPPEYLLYWRERMADLIDGLVLMPSQQCQPCPPNPEPGFPCTTDPEFISRYQQSYDNALEAAGIVCGQ